MSDEPDTEIEADTAGLLSLFLKEVHHIESRKFEQDESDYHYDRRNAVATVQKKLNTLLTEALQNKDSVDLQSLNIPSDMKSTARRAINSRVSEADDIQYSRRDLPEDTDDKLTHQLKLLAEDLAE